MNDPARPAAPEPPGPPKAGGAAPGAPVVNEVSWWRYVLLFPLAMIARVWAWTLKFKVSEEDYEALTYNRGPVVNILWHNRLFIISEIIRRYRRERTMMVLVSASKDGAWLTTFFKLIGMIAARGSSSRRGSAALRELLGAVKAGLDIGITPDGPRGPCYEIKPGAAMAARVTGLPLLLISARFESAWRLKSWDGFYLPKPFSTVEMRGRLLPDYAALGASHDEAAAVKMREQMLEITTD